MIGCQNETDAPPLTTSEDPVVAAEDENRIPPEPGSEPVQQPTHPGEAVSAAVTEEPPVEPEDDEAAALSEPTPSERAELISRAKAAILADSPREDNYSIRSEIVTDRGENWEVSFPFLPSARRLGGGLHVLLSKGDYSVVRVWRTR